MNNLEELQTILALPAKERYKKLRSFYFSLMESIETITPDEVSPLLTSLDDLIKVTTFDHELRKLRPTLSRLHSDSSGLQKINILQEQTFSVSVESGVIAVADPAVYSDVTFSDYSDKEFSQLMQEHAALLFGTGGDGLFSVTVRLTDATQPVLTDDEMTQLITNTDTSIVKITANTLAIADLHAISETTNTFSISSGEYAVCSYFLDTEDYADPRFVVVLCPAATTLSKDVNFVVLDQ